MEPWYLSVDVETAGPHPARYSMLAIGACVVADPDLAFYAELRPEHEASDPTALAVSGLSMGHLREHGEDPAEAIARFAAWVAEITPPGRTPVFVGFNAPFDWMFLTDAFHRHLGRNPFGHAALDVKALAMGAGRVGWGDTAFADVARRHGIDADLPHHALEDARLQAEVFRRILAAIGQNGGPA